jgi:hypothetical protein
MSLTIMNGASASSIPSLRSAPMNPADVNPFKTKPTTYGLLTDPPPKPESDPSDLKLQPTSGAAAGSNSPGRVLNLLA